MPRISRRALAATIAVSTLLPGAAFAADALKEIRIDWATYNPVSMVLKQKGLLEKEFAKDGISVVWVQSAGSNKALEFLNAGSIDFGSTAGSAALVAKINGNPIKSIYVYSRPEWTALVTRKDSPITKVSELKGKRVERGGDPRGIETLIRLHAVLSHDAVHDLSRYRTAQTLSRMIVRQQWFYAGFAPLWVKLFSQRRFRGRYFLVDVMA